MITRIVVLLLLASSATIKANDEDIDDVTIETVEETPSVDIPYESPKPSDDSKVYFAEHFDDPARFEKRWIKSRAKKEGISEDIAKYDGEWSVERPQRDGLAGDLGLVLKSKAKHSAISSKLPKPFVFAEKPLIVQYEVLLQDGQECGGAYLKLLTSGVNAKNLEEFHDKTPYSIMFGPDKCGNDHKLHFIFNHRNPKNGSVEEKHCKKPKERIEDFFTDKLPHLYTLIIKPDSTFEVLVDKNVVNSGSLLEDFTPPVNPPAEIDDPTDQKPEDWDEREKIPDPEAKKPDDWDEDAPAQIVDEAAVMPDGWLENEPTHVPDTAAKRPEDWDTEMDGEWEPPLIENPACAAAVGCGPWEPPLINNPAFKGKWRAPLIDNPNYKGKWRPRKIPNPDYYEDKEPFKMQPVEAIGFELWTMSKDILFDNIIITDEYVVAERWAADTFEKKRQKIAKDSVSLWGRMLRAMNYRPKSWALYFIYCTMPLFFYIRHLWQYVKEESVIQKVVNVTNEYPALWILYIVVLVGIVHLVLVVCRKPSRTLTQSEEKEEQQKAADGDKKKTDEVTEDDDKPLIEEVDVDKKAEEDDEYAEKHSNPSSDDEDEEGEEEIEVEQLEESEPKDEKEGTRKRKVRKE